MNLAALYWAVAIGCEPLITKEMMMVTEALKIEPPATDDAGISVARILDEQGEIKYQIQSGKYASEEQASLALRDLMQAAREGRKVAERRLALDPGATCSEGKL